VQTADIIKSNAKISIRFFDDREVRALGDELNNKFDYDIGRFTSTDVLFEKYYGWSPYQYSANNPINLLDWNGSI